MSVDPVARGVPYDAVTGNARVDVKNQPADPDAVSTWVVTASADNAAAVATQAAVAGQSHYITSIAGSFSAANAGKLMTVEDGAGVVGNYHIHNQRELAFGKPLRLTAGNAATLRLAASGTVGQFGAVTMTGYTR